MLGVPNTCLSLEPSTTNQRSPQYSCRGKPELRNLERRVRSGRELKIAPARVLRACNPWARSWAAKPWRSFSSDDALKTERIFISCIKKTKPYSSRNAVVNISPNISETLNIRRMTIDLIRSYIGWTLDIEKKQVRGWPARTGQARLLIRWPRWVYAGLRFR